MEILNNSLIPEKKLKFQLHPPFPKISFGNNNATSNQRPLFYTELLRTNRLLVMLELAAWDQR